MPSVVYPDPEGPFGHFETFGWRWQPERSADENLLALTMMIRYSASRPGARGRVVAALLCRRPAGRPPRELRVLAFGASAPPSASAAPGLAVVELLGGSPTHAEVQLLARCARAGIRVAGAWLYVGKAPCWECSKALYAAGIARVVFADDAFRDEPGRPQPRGREQELAEAAGIEWVGCRVSREDQDEMDEQFRRWRAERGLDRSSLKALAALEPL